MSSSLMRNEFLVLAARFRAMVSPRLVISAVRLFCCWRRRIAPTSNTVETTSEGIKKAKFEL